MRGFPVRTCAALLVFWAGLFPSARFAAAQQAPPPPGSSLQLQRIHTIGREDFHESLRDRLSGGLNRQFPFRMATDSLGRILITEPFLSRVRVYDTKQGKHFELHGDKGQHMVFPTYIAVDADDNIYVSEPLLSAVLVFSPDGRFLRAIGADHLYVPFGLAVDAPSHKLFVVDHYRSEIQVYTLEGQLLQVISERGRAAGQLWDPCDLVLHHGMIFVLDTGNARFQIFDRQGYSRALWPFGNDRWPVAFALDAAGHLYIIDMESRGMVISDESGNSIGAGHTDPLRAAEQRNNVAELHERAGKPGWFRAGASPGNDCRGPQSGVGSGRANRRDTAGRAAQSSSAVAPSFAKKLLVISLFCLCSHFGNA